MKSLVLRNVVKKMTCTENRERTPLHMSNKPNSFIQVEGATLYTSLAECGKHEWGAVA